HSGGGKCDRAVARLPVRHRRPGRGRTGEAQDAQRHQGESRPAERNETGHGTSPSVCGTMTTAAVGAQTGRPGVAGPVGTSLAGRAPPAAFVRSSDVYDPGPVPQG